MEELFNMNRDLLRELLVMHYRHIGSVEEKKMFLGKVLAWRRSDEGFADHEETAGAVDDFKTEIFENLGAADGINPDEMEKYIAQNGLANLNANGIQNVRNDVTGELRNTYFTTVFKVREYSVIGHQDTNVTAESVSRYMVYHSAIQNTPWLLDGKRNDGIEKMSEPVAMFDSNILKIKARTFGIKSATETKIQLLDVNDADIIGSYLKTSGEFVSGLMRDTDLMSRQPFLKAFTRMYHLELEKALSAEDGSLSHIKEPGYSMMTGLFNQIKKVPSEDELNTLREQDPGAYAASRKVMALFNAFVEMEEEKVNFKNLSYEELSGDHADVIRARMDRKLADFEHAVREFSQTPTDDIKHFYEHLGALGNDMDIQLGIINDDEKAKPAVVIADIEDKRRLLENGVLPDEVAFIREFAAEMESSFGSKRLGEKAAGTVPPYKELLEELAALAEEGKRKLENGFESSQDKMDLFKRMGTACKNLKNATAELKDKGDLPKPEGADNRAWIYTRGVIESVWEFGTYKQGASYEAERRAGGLLMYDKMKDSEFKTQFDNFLAMMEDTGDGYLFHTNSREYTKMMDTLRTVKKLSEKEELTGFEINSLAENGANISKVISDYIGQDKKLRKQKTDTGKDRFDGAMGILKLVDPQKAEKFREKAEQKRGKRVTWKEIDDRSVRKARKRNREHHNTAAKSLEQGLHK